MNVLGFEMEAAGLTNDLGCALIRCVCDYAALQSHRGTSQHAEMVAVRTTDIFPIIRLVVPIAVTSSRGDINEKDTAIIKKRLSDIPQLAKMAHEADMTLPGTEALCSATVKLPGNDPEAGFRVYLFSFHDKPNNLFSKSQLGSAITIYRITNSH